MKMSDVLKAIEQMFRDKRPANEIHAAVARYREMAEAEEEASANPVTPEQKLVLEILDAAADYMEQDDVARKIGVPVQRVIWMLERLTERGYLAWANQHRYRIEQKGRDFLYDPSA